MFFLDQPCLSKSSLSFDDQTCRHDGRHITAYSYCTRTGTTAFYGTYGTCYTIRTYRFFRTSIAGGGGDTLDRKAGAGSKVEGIAFSFRIILVESLCCVDRNEEARLQVVLAPVARPVHDQARPARGGTTWHDRHPPSSSRPPAGVGVTRAGPQAGVTCVAPWSPRQVSYFRPRSEVRPPRPRPSRPAGWVEPPSRERNRACEARV